jgi:hypothetical protein
MRCLASVLLIGILLVPSTLGAATARWQQTLSPHFSVYHENSFLPAGLMMELGRIHNRLRLDLSAFAPWMAKERMKVYLYKGHKSYVLGDFDPPSWSNGVAFYQTKTIATYEMKPVKKVFNVLAHEMTHLLFESYWGEQRKTPPVWLNEGLAMLEEDGAGGAKKSAWFQAMQLLDNKTIKMSKFFRIRPTTDLKDASKETVTVWYVQAYSVVYFLYRRHSRLQFLNFCRMLREGKTLDESLWTVYRFRDSKAFEKAWRNWLRKPSTRASFTGLASVSPEPAPRESFSRRTRRGRSSSKRSSKKKLKTVGFGNLQFHGLNSQK